MKQMSIILLLVIFGLKAITAEPSILSKEEILSINPEKFLEFDHDQLNQQAGQYAEKGDYQKCASLRIEILNHFPYDYGSWYELACCYSVFGNAEKAAYCLDKAVKYGFYHQKFLNEDADLAKSKDQPVFKEKLGVINRYLDYLGKTEYAESGGMLIKYHVVYPVGYQKDKSYPLVISLHGYTSNSEHSAISFGEKQESENKEFISVFIQAPFSIPVQQRVWNLADNVEQYSWTITDAGIENLNKSREFSAEAVHSVLTRIKEMHKIRESFILGHSQGATQAYYNSLKYPTDFKATLCYGGNLPKNMPIEKKSASENSPQFFIAHGKNDNTVSPEKSISAQNELNKAGFKTELYLYDGEHAITTTAQSRGLKWLKEHFDFK